MLAARSFGFHRSAACLTACLAACLFSATNASAQVRISQISTQGGLGGSGAFDFDNAPYYADFVELYNAGGSPVNLSGYSLQWTGVQGTTWTQFVNLTGTIPANGYYLVQLTDPLSVGGPYPVTPDDIRSGTTASQLISSGGKVALVNNTTALSGACPNFAASGIIDFVGITGGTGAGTNIADCFEGAAAIMTTASGFNSPRFALHRKCGGTIDTDNNQNDFEARPPNPHNSSSPVFPGIEITVSLSSPATNPCYPTSTGYLSAVRGTSSVLITVSRTTCSGAPSTGGTVTADLTALGGPAAQPLFDDQTNGDVTAGDNIYSYNFAVPLNAPLGPNRTINVTLTDAQARTQSGTAFILVEAELPPNDVCESATLINSVPFIDADINNRLLNDTNDGQPSCLSGSTLVRRGVWYTYTPSQNGFGIISESGSQSSVIAVYTGADCASKVSMTAAQNGCYVASSTNNRFVPMTAGTTYWILIGPSSTTTSCPTTHSYMTFEFDFATTPTNDLCTGAFNLNSVSLPYNTQVQWIAATDDPGVPCAPAANANTGRRGVWFRYTPAQSGVISLNESVGGTEGNVLHAVYSGSDCFSLTNEFCTLTDTNQGTFLAAGQTYWILLAGDFTSATPSAAPPWNYTVSFEPLSPPPNDSICTAQDVSAGGNFTVDNRAADNDTTFTVCLGSGVSETRLAVFYKYTASANGVLKVVEDTTQQNIDITAYEGATCNSLVYLGCTSNDSMIVEVQNGQTYWFMIGHGGTSFTFPTVDLSTTFTFSTPPANDTACNASVLVPDTNQTIDNSFALPDTDVPCNTSSAENTWHGLWYTYTPLVNCTSLLIESSSQNSVISIYTGPNCNSLTEYYCTDNDPTTAANGDYVDLYANQQYWFLVGINSSSAAAVPTVSQVFGITCGTPAAGDACPSAVTIPSLPFNTVIDNSTYTANMPAGACDPSTIIPGSMRHDAWYKYVATSNCVARVSIDPSSNYDLLFQVWEGPDCQNLTNIGCVDYHEASSGTPEYRNVPMVSGRTYWFQFGKSGTTNISSGTTSTVFDIEVCTPGPANDMPCQATVLSTFPFSDSVDFTYATNDLWAVDIISTFPPPVNFCGSGEETESYYGVWYTYTATSNCSLIIEDVGPTDVALSAWIGTCNGLLQVGCTGGSTFETMSIPMSIGQQYWFLVSAFGFSQPDPFSGTFEVNFDCRMPPPNDYECNPTDLNMTGLPYFVDIDIAAAQDDPNFQGENCTAASTQTVAPNGTWYTYTPPADCTLTLADGPDTNASFAVYTGFDCFGLFELVCTSTDTLSYGLTGGTTYWILATHNGPNPGMPTSAHMFLTIDCSQPPANDGICNATLIGATPFAASQSISLATDDFPIGCNSSGGSLNTQKGLWWRYTPAADCIAQISETSSLNVAIAVFQGSDCNGTFEAGCTSAEHFGFPMIANETYWILIGLESTTPTFPTANLSMTFDCLPTTVPANDEVCGATVINSLPFTAQPSIAAATNDLDVSCNEVEATSVDYGVWYQYTPASDCTVILAESSINNVVWGIFTGTDCNNLNQVGCSQTEIGSSIGLTAATPYWILVGLDWNTNGNPPTMPGLPLDLLIDCASVPANDTCETAEVIPGTSFATSYNPFFAADGQPVGSCNSTSASSMDNDVWFKWTAPSNCDVTIDLQDTTSVFAYGQMVVVYVGDDCNNLLEYVCRYSSGSTNQLPFSFTAFAGETYWFQNGRRSFSTGSNLGPTDFSLEAECTAGCATCPADLSGDSALNGDDVQKFTDCVILANNGAPTAGCDCADVAVDSVVNTADIAAFVSTLLNPPACE